MSVAEFAIDHGKPSGRASICKACDREKARRYYAKHRERILGAYRVSQSAKPCMLCGGVMQSNRHSYCLTCRAKVASRERARGRSGRGWGGFRPEQRVCESCGASFMAFAPHARFCRKACRHRSYKKDPMKMESMYGVRHRRRRQQWAPVVATGKVDCARCGKRIRAGEPWDLGHDDADPSRYVGPEHARCNRATSAHRVALNSRCW